MGPTIIRSYPERVFRHLIKELTLIIKFGYFNWLIVIHPMNTVSSVNKFNNSVSVFPLLKYTFFYRLLSLFLDYRSSDSSFSQHVIMTHKKYC